MDDHDSKLLKDVADVYCRLFDHRALLQSEHKTFVEYFEEKVCVRGGDNLQKGLELTREVNEKLLDKCVEEMTIHLPQFNLKVTEAVSKIDSTLKLQDSTEEKVDLEANSAHRVEEWRDFMDEMCERSKKIDTTHEEEVKKIEHYYKELENKLCRI